MAKFKAKLPSEDAGRKFMNGVSELTGLEINEVEEYLKCKNENISVSCQLKFDGKSFVMVKTENQELLDQIKQLLDN